MSKKILFTAALCMSLCQTILCAEPNKATLDISQVLELVNARNKDVSVARQNVQISEQGERVANAAKLPDISASLTVNYLSDLTVMDRDFTNAQQVSMPHLGNSLKLNLYQPVYAGGAITAGVNLAKSKTLLSETNLEQTRQSIGMQAIGCYLELFKAYNLQQVYKENIELTNTLLKDMTAKHAEGVVLKNDITRYELRLSSLNYDLLTIENRIAVLNHDLCILLGYPEDTEICTDISNDLENLPTLETAKEWYDRSVSNSLSLKSLDIQKRMNEQQRKLLKAEQLPHIGIVAGNTFAGPIDFEVPVINSNYNLYFIGVNLEYNFASLYKTNKSLAKNAFEREEIEMQRDATVDALSRTIDNTYTQYTQAFKMLETESKNVELAGENYRIVENRYNNQLALLTDMLDASTAKLDADVRLVNARVNIIYYYYQLKYNSSTL
jgi:outer membrane protein TolC